jgi:ATP-dependent helicase/nuclease subunit A
MMGRPGVVVGGSARAMKPKQLQPEQAAAAYEIRKHISVTAGPGSGKTTVLVERYLHILREHKLSIDQIVAITFTNRAANEMRERLREQLNHILGTASEDERRDWLKYKRTLDGAVITTIHGFCARLLREFPVEARVDPQFLLLDEHRAAMLLESVVDEALREFITSGHPEISRLTLGVGRARLADALAQLYREVRGQGMSLQDLALLTAESHATEEDHERALVDLSRTMNDFLLAPRKTTAQKTNQAIVSSTWPEIRTLLRTVPAVDKLADYCRSVESFRELRPQARDNLKAHVQALDELIWNREMAGRVPQLCLDLFAKQYALELVNVLIRIDQRLNEEKQKLSALDFDDLELRALGLLQRPEVMTRAAERYKYFLVDEFQDTNGLQRRLLEQLALQKGRRESANLFIVGDRKQSIYGFRGADVDVFREMTGTLLSAGGEEKPLRLNFRSQPPLISFFNFLFDRLFLPQEEIAPAALKDLGYVEHELSEPRREPNNGGDSGPLVELMITTEASGADDDPKAEQNSRELDAEQLARRIISLVDADAPNYSQIALLFRAMTQVQKYETVFRRENIPYQTVLGRGFYERPEITDLIQLLRFLDNKTDELALAAVLRSPLCGLSDNALLALRCAPWRNELDGAETPDGFDPLLHFTQTRQLFTALRRHNKIAFINDEEHELLDRAADLIGALTARRHHYPIGKLLRFAVDESEFLTVIAATFDGAQRLANVERLFTLAERFEHSGTHLIRDFVRYVEEFEAIGSRESEGQIDEAANAVRLMTIHQAKGLEFPIVILPDLQRLSRPMENWVLLDRRRGLTLKVPDGRGGQVSGSTFSHFEQRHAWRAQFESMRLLYVAATRAQDRLILSGTTKDLESLNKKTDTWLKWIWQSLELQATESGVITLADDVQVQLSVNVADEPSPQAKEPEDAPVDMIAENSDSLAATFPLLGAIEPQGDRALNRFSVTQLINYRRCPRQYYFDRVLHAPAPDAIAVWNDAEAPEPPANLTATLKGAVVHRFCETFVTGDEPSERLLRSFKDVTAARQAELAERWLEIDEDKAIKDLLPLALNYLSSPVFERVEAARRASAGLAVGMPAGVEGLWSELSFRLRRPLGVLTGAIDKLLVTRSGQCLDIEIIDFKTNRLPRPQAAPRTEDAGATRRQKPKSASVVEVGQIAFDFSAPVPGPVLTVAPDHETESTVEAIARVAADYQLQMQAYALAVWELMPSVITRDHRIRVTLHFLEPNVEFHLADELLDAVACASSIDEAMREITHARVPENFPVRPAMHCRMCNFLELCHAGRQWLGGALARP